MLRSIVTGIFICCLSLSSYTQTISTVQELLKAVINATGGEEAWRKIKTAEVMQEANGGLLGKGRITIVAHFPGFYKYEYRHEEKDFLLLGLFVPDKIPVSWIVLNGERRAIRTPNSRSNLFASQEMNMLYDSLWQLQPLRTEIREGESYYVVEGKYKEVSQKRYYCFKTLLLKIMEQEIDAGIRSVSKFSDYRKTDGVTRAWKVNRVVEDPQFGNSQSEENVLLLKYNGVISVEAFNPQ